MKNLDEKLNNIRSGNYKPSDFIIADAKDADMGGGRRAPGYLREKNGSLTDIPDTYDSYLKKMDEMTKSEMVDVMLMSMTSAEKLVGNKIFDNSPVTPAVRLNDTSCIWGMLRHGEYDKEESRPFATTQLRHAINYVDLGLYSMTFNKNVDRDVFMLNQYRNFRDDAEKIGMRHFLEVFNSATMKLPINEMGQYINDCILKTLAGQISKEKPLFFSKVEILLIFNKLTCPGGNNCTCSVFATIHSKLSVLGVEKKNKPSFFSIFFTELNKKF